MSWSLWTINSVWTYHTCLNLLYVCLESWLLYCSRTSCYNFAALEYKNWDSNYRTGQRPYICDQVLQCECNHRLTYCNVNLITGLPSLTLLSPAHSLWLWLQDPFTCWWGFKEKFLKLSQRLIFVTIQINLAKEEQVLFYINLSKKTDHSTKARHDASGKFRSIQTLCCQLKQSFHDSLTDIPEEDIEFDSPAMVPNRSRYG